MSRCRPAHLVVVALVLACALPCSAAAAAATVPAPVPVSPANRAVLTDNRPVIEYRADPATTVTFELDGLMFPPQVPFADGTVDFFSMPLSPGLHTVRARATDALATNSEWSPTTGFWIGTGNPDNGGTVDSSDDTGDDDSDAPDATTTAPVA